jgi:all-trans-retinol 13,14-reductase
MEPAVTERRPDRPWSHDIPDGTWDYIVIGTGIGGMAAAAMLSKLGRRVLVLEQHNIPGGFTQMFKRPGYRWDVGVHIVGEMSRMSYPGRLLTALTDGRLQWEPVGEIYDEFNFPDGFTIQLPDSPERFRETLIDYFPAERAAVDDYLALTRSAARAAAKYLQVRAMPRLLAPGGRKQATEAARPHIHTTTAEVLARLTDNPRLRAVLAAQWGYYGATPARSSFAMHALMVRHFLRGAYYPVGGASSIAREMLATVAAAGGWTAVRHTVEEIVVRHGSVAGVRLSDGTEIAAKRVVSAAGAIPTSDLLETGLPGTGEPYREAGPAHVSVYLGFKGDIAAHGAERYCQWYFDTWDMEEDIWDVHPDRPIEPATILFCSFPSLKDPTHDPGPEQRNTGEVITFVPWDSFSQWSGTKWKKRGPAYDAFKESLTSTLLDQYLTHYPGLAPMVDHVEMSTPLSTNHFAASPRGSIYGLGTTPDRFDDQSVLPRTGIKGLYLGGADVSAPGIAGALGGGVMAAAAAEPVKGARFLQPLMKRPQG